MLMIKVVKAIIVRAALLLHLTMTVWRVTVDLKDEMYWLMFCATVPFIFESFYTVIKRKGEDYLLFTPCFFFYLFTTIPCVWLLELRKTDVYISGQEDTLFNKTIEEEVPLEGLALDINPNTWTILIEEFLLYLLIIGRWVLPRGEVTREQLSELLFAFIGIASDIMEMFSLFGEHEVRTNRTLSYCVLSVWSLSVTQFCMTLTVTHKPRKAKNIRVYDDNEDPEKKKATISNEIIAILLSMVMQDVPFVTVRLYTIITYKLVTYSLVFFTSKNCLVICLLLYKIAVLLQKRYCPENVKEKSDDDGELYIIGDEGSDNSKGKKSKMKPDLNDTGSASTGGSKEKQKLERFYEENESESGRNVRERKSKKAEDVPNSLPLSKVDKSPSKSSTSPSPSANNTNKSKTPTQKSPNEKTPLNSPAKSSLNGQMPQSSSTPSIAKRSPTDSTPGTPKTQKTPSTPSSAAPTPKTSTASRPRPTPTKAPQNPPKTKTSPQKSAGTPSPQHQQQQQTPAKPQQPQKSPDAPIASGFGWISSKPKEGDDVIVAKLS